MLKLSNTDHLFVKGFAQDEDLEVSTNPKELKGEFVVVYTDLVTSGQCKVSSAVLNDESKWEITLPDGREFVLKQEPANSRELEYGRIVTNVTCGMLGHNYNPVFLEEFEEVAKSICEGDKSYKLVGYVGGREVITSHLVKLWRDSNGLHHGITVSGSHYVF